MVVLDFLLRGNEYWNVGAMEHTSLNGILRSTPDVSIMPGTIIHITFRIIILVVITHPASDIKGPITQRPKQSLGIGKL